MTQIVIINRGRLNNKKQKFSLKTLHIVAICLGVHDFHAKRLPPHLPPAIERTTVECQHYYSVHK